MLASNKSYTVLQICPVYLEDFYDTFLASCHVHGLENLAVLASTQLPDYLVVVLVPGGHNKQCSEREREGGREGGRERERTMCWSGDSIGHTAESARRGGFGFCLGVKLMCCNVISKREACSF